MAVKRVSKSKRAKKSKAARVVKKKTPKKAKAAKKALKKAARRIRIIAPPEASAAVTMYGMVSAYANSRGYRVRPVAAHWLRNSTVEVAAKQVHPMLAFEAYKKLIDAMIEESKTIPNYAPGGIGERTLFPALRRLCPLFPIC
jgi:hypothetical protein